MLATDCSLIDRLITYPTFTHTTLLKFGILVPIRCRLVVKSCFELISILAKAGGQTFVGVVWEETVSLNLNLCKNMMPHQLIVAVLVSASIYVQCHAFRRIARRSTLPISTITKSDLHSIRRHHLNQPRYQYINFYSIRGGSDNDYENVEDQYDYDDDELTLDFIASFESELAEIRREAEREAENEMLKLRGLIERRGEEEDVAEEEENITDIEDNNNIDDVESNENDQASSIVEEEEEELDNEIPEEEEPDTISNEETNVIDQTETESEEVLPSNESEETIDLDSDVEEQTAETIMVEDDDYLQYQEITGELPDESVVIDDYSGEESDVETTPSSAEVVDETTPTVDETIVIVDETAGDDDTVIDAKSKVSKKKKKKTSKQDKKKKKKTRINVSEESELSEHGEQVIDLGDSVMLSKEVAKPRQSGIMFYLRSDLGRALCLFIATIVIAILTTRMQRQMEAEGI